VATATAIASSKLLDAAVIESVAYDHIRRLSLRKRTKGRKSHKIVNNGFAIRTTSNGS
jgi:hypothetical protein